MHDDWDEERQLEAAIALSLQQQPESPLVSPAQRVKVIDLCSDEETEVLKPPVPQERARSYQVIELGGQRKTGVGHAVGEPRAVFAQEDEGRAPGSLYSLPENKSLGGFNRDARQITPTGAPSFLQSIDRRRMEEERLARKRKAPISPPPRRAVKTAKQAESSGITVSGATGERNTQGLSYLSSSTRGETNLMQNASTPGRLGVQYPRGTIKKTWARSHRRDGDIKLEEVLQKVRSPHVSQLRHSFQYQYSRRSWNLPVRVLICQ
jgi:hypothetical protein